MRTAKLDETSALKTMGVEAQEIASPSYIPTRIVFGLGALSHLYELLSELSAEYKPRKILLLTGRRSATKPWQEVAIQAVAEYEHVFLENTQSNPTIESITEVLDRARAERVDFVIGLGGGSVLDTAKIVALLTRSDISLTCALGGQEMRLEPVPMVAIPTTSGTGAEVTSFATVWDGHKKRKHSLADARMYPTLAVVDPSLTATLPRELAASTGLDAFAHAIESTWSVNSSRQSRSFGLRAITLLAKNLESLLRNPDNRDLRARVSLASVYAGISLAQGKTTISHAISYPLTAYYNLPHGYACGLTLGALVRFNSDVSAHDCLDRRGVGHVREVLKQILQALAVSDGEAAERRVQMMIRALGLKLFYEHHEFNLNDILAEVMSYDRFSNNPRAMSREQLALFFESLKCSP